MLQVNQLVGFGGGVSSDPDATIEYRGNFVDTASGPTYTFSSKDLGSSATSHKVIVGASGGGSGPGSVSSITVGGSSATVSVSVQANSEQRTELWYIDGVTATSGNIVVTFSGGSGCHRCGIGVWAIYNGATGAANDTGSSTSDPATDTLNISAGGVAIGYAKGGVDPAWTWTNLTEDFDAEMETSTHHSGASDAFASAQVSLSITANPSNSSSHSEMVIASWDKA